MLTSETNKNNLNNPITILTELDLIKTINFVKHFLDLIYKIGTYQPWG